MNGDDKTKPLSGKAVEKDLETDLEYRRVEGLSVSTNFSYLKLLPSLAHQFIFVVVFLHLAAVAIWLGCIPAG